jgi:hypothetical protein
MSNSYSSSLLTDELAAQAATVIGATLPRGLAQQVTVRPLPKESKPKSVAHIKVVASTAATTTNPTSYESGDSTINNLAITPTYLLQAFNASHAD